MTGRFPTPTRETGEGRVPGGFWFTDVCYRLAGTRLGSACVRWAAMHPPATAMATTGAGAGAGAAGTEGAQGSPKGSAAGVWAWPGCFPGPVRGGAFSRGAVSTVYAQGAHAARAVQAWWRHLRGGRREGLAVGVVAGVLALAVIRGIIEGTALHARGTVALVRPGMPTPTPMPMPMPMPMPRRAGAVGVKGHQDAEVEAPTSTDEVGAPVQGGTGALIPLQPPHGPTDTERCFELRAAEVAMTGCGADAAGCREAAVVATARATFCCPKGGMAAAYGVQVRPLDESGAADGNACAAAEGVLAGGTAVLARSTGSMRVVADLGKLGPEEASGVPEETLAGDARSDADDETRQGASQSLIRAGEVEEVFDEVDAGRPLAFKVVTDACPEGAAWGAAVLPADFFDFDAGFCSEGRARALW